MAGSRIVGEEVVLLVWVVMGIKSLSEIFHPGGWDTGWPEGGRWQEFHGPFLS